MIDLIDLILSGFQRIFNSFIAKHSFIAKMGRGSPFFFASSRHFACTVFSSPSSVSLGWVFVRCEYVSGCVLRFSHVLLSVTGLFYYFGSLWFSGLWALVVSHFPVYRCLYFCENTSWSVPPCFLGVLQRLHSHAKRDTVHLLIAWLWFYWL